MLEPSGVFTDPLGLVGNNVQFPVDQPPRLLVLVHTEEEFDWDAGFSRNNVGVTHVAELQNAQDIITSIGFNPIYFCGYPIIQSVEAVDILKPWFESGQAYLGTHLHPWVCPPYDEEVNVFNSYQGNLPPILERAKILNLTNALESKFGIRPIAYLAGRYGIGPATVDSLVELGYCIDFSPSPGWDYRIEGGPNFESMSAHAFWNKAHPELLHVPHSGGYYGTMTRDGRSLVGTGQWAKLMRIPGIMSRLGLSRKARVTVEGDISLKNLIALTNNLLANGVKLITLSFHSPSVAIGFTPYSKNRADRDALLRRMKDYLIFFRDQVGGKACGPEEAVSLARLSSLESNA